MSSGSALVLSPHNNLMNNRDEDISISEGSKASNNNDYDGSTTGEEEKQQNSYKFSQEEQSPSLSSSLPKKDNEAVGSTVFRSFAKGILGNSSRSNNLDDSLTGSRRRRRVTLDVDATKKEKEQDEHDNHDDNNTEAKTKEELSTTNK